MHLSRNIAFLWVALCLWPALAGCGADSGRSRDLVLDRTAWLGSAEGWGLLGLPAQGGPVAYRRAENLELPTWAPPEIGKTARAWLNGTAIWVQFADSRLARYDYRTGNLLDYGRLPLAGLSAPLESGGLVVASSERTLTLVGASAAWEYEYQGRLVQLEAGGGDRVLAVIEEGAEYDLVVLQPPRPEPLGRRRVARLRDLAVALWGNQVYCLPENPDSAIVLGLSLPELEDFLAAPLPEPGRALALTPSGHRLYVAAGQTLQVFQRAGGEPIRTLSLPGAAAALRFGVNGAHLMARLEDGSGIAVLQVGVDSVIGVIALPWDDQLPVIVPGGRLIAAGNGDLVLYDLPRLVEVSRVEVPEPRVWVAVDWQPPRPRAELALLESRRAAAAKDNARRVGGTRSESEASSEGSAAPGYYAVVLAAREREGVDDLVRWLGDIGYPATVNRHEDVMGVVWYRAMVGPYSGRPAAESAAQSLSARYGYKPWIFSETGATPGQAANPDSIRERDGEGTSAW